MTDYLTTYDDNTYLLIDGDIIAYQIAYKVQADCAKDDIDVESIDVPKVVHSKIDTLMNTIINDNQCCHVSTYLTSQDRTNYRFKVATIQPYKGNRKDSVKPYHLNAVRAYLEDEWDAEVVSHMEADDRLGIEATKPGRVSTIATIDKDLLMVDCMYYNIRKREKVMKGQWIKLSENRKKVEGKGVPFFYAQMLLGDTSDNIPGVNGYGPVKTVKALSKCDTEREYYLVVWGIYKDMFSYSARDRFLEVAELLWMRRYGLENIREYLLDNHAFN